MNANFSTPNVGRTRLLRQSAPSGTMKFSTNQTPAKTRTPRWFAQHQLFPQFPSLASSASDLGTPTISGTVTALNFRKAYSVVSASHFPIKSAAAYHLHACISQKAAGPEQPVLGTSYPPPRTQRLVETTHIFKGSFRQLVIPAILNFFDLSGHFVVIYIDHALNCVFRTDALDRVLCSEIKLDWIAG